jgi:hypothetical protein
MAYTDVPIREDSQPSTYILWSWVETWCLLDMRIVYGYSCVFLVLCSGWLSEKWFRNLQVLRIEFLTFRIFLVVFPGLHLSIVGLFQGCLRVYGVYFGLATKKWSDTTRVALASVEVFPPAHYTVSFVESLLHFSHPSN